MIKKVTTATFQDGGYKGVYDWSGGIPLTIGEIVTVVKDSQHFAYRLIDKKTTLEDFGEDQKVKTEYYLSLAE